MYDYERLFSVNFYKNKKLMLAEMSFSKPFEAGKRGNAYPGLDDATLFQGVKTNAETRCFTRYFPYASYEMTFEAEKSECGFVFVTPEGEALLKFRAEGGTCRAYCNVERVKNSVVLSGNVSEKDAVILPEDEDTAEFSISGEAVTVIVTARTSFLDIYVKENGRIRYIVTFDTGFSDITKEAVFSRSYVAVTAEAGIVDAIRAVSSYMDCGISQADLRAVRYENGDVLIENGRVFITFSARMQEGAYQAVFSWIPGTMEFDLTGAIFFDAGDGHWQHDVATSLKKNRRTGKWNLFVCSFSHDHIIGHAEFDGDVRYGVNVVDIDLMKAEETRFSPKRGDEDPDFIYDEATGKWYLCICRLMENAGYRYYVFESGRTFDGYRYIGRTKDGEATGGTLSFKENTEGSRLLTLTMGANFDVTSDYREYAIAENGAVQTDEDGLFSAYHPLTFDFPDGGFRGWGNVITLKKGTRTEEYLLTFDRSLGSDWNWSYGTIYCFSRVSFTIVSQIST